MTLFCTTFRRELIANDASTIHLRAEELFLSLTCLLPLHPLHYLTRLGLTDHTRCLIYAHVCLLPFDFDVVPVTCVTLFVTATLPFPLPPTRVRTRWAPFT